MVGIRRIFLAFSLLLAPPAAAQNVDVFREGAPPPAPSVAKPVHPRPAPQSEPEYPAVTPSPAAPAPTLPPTPQVWARIRQAALAAGVAVPLASSPPFDEVTTPPQYRALLGAWGPAAWQGANEKMILIVQSVDPQGTVRGIVGTNYTGDSWWNFAAPIAANRFVVHFQRTYYRQGYMPGTVPLADNNWPIELRADGMLVGSRDGGASVIMLSRLR
jgi:hypothetical protein